jgi:putative transcriptional regulator
LTKFELKLEIAPLLEQPVYFGGPVQVERGFVLHESNPHFSYSSSLIIPGGLTMTTSKDVLEAVALGKGPRSFLTPPYGQRYEKTMSHLGFDMSSLSGQAGHA